LAAWFRLKYPHITVGSIASSAPVLAVLDMSSYMDVVDQSLETIAGKECVDNIRNATAMAEELLKDAAGRKQLDRNFNMCNAPDPDDKLNLAFMEFAWASIFMGTVQYEGERGSRTSIKQLCNIMNDETVPLPIARYAKLSASGSCRDYNYSQWIKYVRDMNPSEYNYFRPWYYQTCTEFGYYQTTDSVNQPFGTLVGVELFQALCNEGFGVGWPPRIDETNAQYGGLDFQGSNVVFVNGALDPWHSLSILKTSNPSLRTIYIKGAAHCADMLPDSDPNSPISKAQVQIGEIVHQWVQSAPRRWL